MKKNSFYKNAELYRGLEVIHRPTYEELEKENIELQEQIEKMINEIDKTMVFSNMRECEICDIQNIFRKYNFRWNNDKWEIKEK